MARVIIAIVTKQCPVSKNTAFAKFGENLDVVCFVGRFLLSETRDMTVSVVTELSFTKEAKGFVSGVEPHVTYN